MNRAFGTRTAIKLGIGVSALAIGTQQAAAQATCGEGSTDQVCQITNTGAVGPIFGQAGKGTVVSNSGTITGTPAISLGNSFLLAVDNKAGGVIDGNGGAAIVASRPSVGFYVRN